MKTQFKALLFLSFHLACLSAFGQEVFFSSDFGAEARKSWRTFHNANNQGSNPDWFFTAKGPTPIRNTIAALKSATAANGWAIFDSGLNCNPSTGQDAWLVSPAIRTGERGDVILSFQTFYRKHNDKVQIRVGTDLSNRAGWDSYEVFPGFIYRQYPGIPALGTNPTTVTIDISNSVIGKDSFYFAFQYLSDKSTVIGGSNTPIACGYSWQVDDVRLSSNISFSKLSCGSVIKGDNRNARNNLSGTQYSGCSTGLSLYQGPEKLYQFKVESEKTVVIQMAENQAQLDLFLLGSDAKGLPSGCLDASLAGGGGYQEIVRRLAPGTYWISVDSKSPDSRTGSFELSLDCYDEDKRASIGCGETLLGSTAGKADSLNSSHYASCLGPVLVTPYQAGDEVYTFSLAQAQTVSIRLSSLSGAGLELFLFPKAPTGQLGSCIAKGVVLEQSGQTVVTAALGAGSYAIAVDGALVPAFPKNIVEEGPFLLSLECFPAENAGSIRCGETLTASTLGRQSRFSGREYRKNAGGPASHPGPDRAFLFELRGGPQKVSVSLANKGNADLDLFLLKSDAQGGTGAFVAKSEQAGPGDEALALNLESGFYLLVVDGKTGASAGPFTLGLNCFPLPSLCDLGGLTLRKGNALTGVIYDDYLLYGAGIYSKNLPADYRDFVPCLAEMGSGQIFARVYNYFHDGKEPFSVDIKTADSRLRTFVFKCADSTRAKACRTLSGSGRLTVNDAAGVYVILIADTKTGGSYTIRMLPQDPCVPDVQTPVAFDTLLSLAGKRNDLDSRNYRGCYSGNTPYDGEDMVFCLDFSGFIQDLNRDGASLGIVVESKARLGLFLFSDLCGESCLAYAETTAASPNGGLIIPQGAIREGPLYLVVDKASQGDPVFDFKLILYLDIYNNHCPDNSSTHQLSFSGVSLPFLDPSKDRLFVTYNRNLNPDLFFINNEVRWSTTTPGALESLALQGGAGDGIQEGKKCRYSEGEEFLVIAQKDGMVMELTPTFRVGPLARDGNRFKSGGRSQIASLSITRVEQAALLTVVPTLMELPPGKKDALPITIESNKSWGILDTLPDWLHLSDAGGDGDDMVYLEVEANTGNTPRVDSFTVEITDPITNGKVQRVVKISQRPSACVTNQLNINAAELVDACGGQANGRISLSVSGVSGKAALNWGQGLKDEAVQADLAPGDYSVTVTDDLGCALSKTFTIREAAPFSVSIAGSGLVCPGKRTILSAGAFSAYRWSSGQTRRSISVPAGSYGLTVTDSRGCTGIGSISVGTYPVTPLTVTGDLFFCADGSATLDAGPGRIAYRWSDGSMSQSITVSHGGAYAVTVTDPNGCRQWAAVAVTQLDPVEVNIVPDGPDCLGESVTLDGGGAEEYRWSTDEDTPFITVTEPGTYSLTVTDFNGCQGVGSISIEECAGLRAPAPGPAGLAVMRADHELLLNQVSLFPNPARNEIFLRLPAQPSEGEVRVMLLDIFGRKAHEGTFKSDLYRLEVGRLPKGIYWVRLLLNGAQATHKVIIE